ncbi:hypothetical protein M501DRAFT_477210 [Patellaria atrata CBS 101060]|uniref:Uncharacterized protein n=1 Tax=Patellaria atrata CBS 101060 TaxID=1346257 RepID=A0A9P4S3V8_9PEZI|nr:hypothetical protein M501DRAFT_477210 [Patellaria atrata CBS 101060]
MSERTVAQEPRKPRFRRKGAGVSGFLSPRVQQDQVAGIVPRPKSEVHVRIMDTSASAAVVVRTCDRRIFYSSCSELVKPDLQLTLRAMCFYHLRRSPLYSRCRLIRDICRSHLNCKFGFFLCRVWSKFLIIRCIFSYVEDKFTSEVTYSTACFSFTTRISCNCRNSVVWSNFWEFLHRKHLV